MHGAIAWFARNPVAANLVMLVVVVGGLMTIPQIRQEIFPEIEAGMISVTVAYPGAAPEEVERGICIRVEEQIQAVEGIEQVRSIATEGVGIITAELLDGADARRVLDDIRSQVDAIDSFPEEAEKPVIQELSVRIQVINVAISGPADERTLKYLGKQVRDGIAALPEISHVELASSRPYEISIEISEESLRRHALRFDDLVGAIRRSSLDLPGGAVKTDSGEILLRTVGQAYRGEEFERLVLMTHADGTRLTLGEVATVVDGFAETDQHARFDGEPAVLVQVFRVGEQNAIDVADAVRRYVARTQPTIPEGISLTTWQDDTVLLESRQATLLRNGRSGFALVCLILALFLRLRLAFWVAVGVPISFLGALWLMPSFDLSINMLSLFAFIVVLGILVDDAIVTGENIHTHQERDPDRLRSSIRGAQEVAIPVTFGVLTTVAAFTPLLFLPGPFGKLSRVIPIIVISALLFSLIESKLVLPSHLAHGTGHRDEQPGNAISRGWKRFQARIAAGLAYLIQDLYQPLLVVALRWRYTTIALAVALFLVTMGVLAGGWLRFTFFPEVEGDNIVAFLTMPQGTPAEVTALRAEQLEKSAEELRELLDRSHPGETSLFRHVLSSIGEQPFRARQSRGTATAAGTPRQSHLAEINLEVVPGELRAISSAEIARRWRESTGPIPDAVELVFTSSIMSTGEPIDLELRGPELAQLRAAAEDLKAVLRNYPGLYDVRDSFREGKRELTLSILPSAEALGLSLQDLGRQVRQAFYGDEAQRILRGRDELRVMVRYPLEERRSLGDVENLRIRLPDGTAVPFASVAEAKLMRGFATIERRERERVVNVTASVDPGVANANEILKSLQSGALPGVMDRFPSVRYSLEGEQREQRETLLALARGFALAMIAIFALLAVPLRSYLQPLIIMSAIPFGLVGAVAGHLLMGFELSMLSVIGVVALSGVVVNDSLVLVNAINERRKEGMTTTRAIRSAGSGRFRPVLLTSLTTFFGLAPMMMEDSAQAQFMIPMAVSLAFGVLFASFITLLLVPASYLVIEDLKALLASAARLPRRRRAHATTGNTSNPDRPQRGPASSR